MDVVNSSVNSSSLAGSDPYLLSAKIFDTVSIVRTILLLPLCSLVLYLGFLRWRPQRSFQSASPSDILTYNLAVMELIWVFTYLCSVFGFVFDVLFLKVIGVFTYVAFYGEMLFNSFICVEWYLAVVHPITYMQVRNARGSRIRNLSIACLWLISVGLSLRNLFKVSDETASLYSNITMFCLLSISMLVTMFCSISVLCVLVRSRPGEGGGADRSKQRAFHTIAMITCVFWLWFVGLLTSVAILQAEVLSVSKATSVVIMMGFLNLPSSLAAPLMFLCRAEKLRCRISLNKAKLQVIVVHFQKNNLPP